MSAITARNRKRSIRINSIVVVDVIIVYSEFGSWIQFRHKFFMFFFAAFFLTIVDFFLFPRNLILGSSSDENLKAWLANEEIYGADNFQAGFTRPTPIRPFCILHRSASDFFPIFWAWHDV